MSSATSKKVRTHFRHDDARDSSGYLLWNTRFVERGFDPDERMPDDAAVTGLLRRYDTSKKTF